MEVELQQPPVPLRLPQGLALGSYCFHHVLPVPWERGQAEEPTSCTKIPTGIHSRRTFPVAQMVKNLPVMQETRARSLGREDPLEKGMAILPSILAWRILWTEKTSGLQSVGSQRVGHE